MLLLGLLLLPLFTFLIPAPASAVEQYQIKNGNSDCKYEIDQPVAVAPGDNTPSSAEINKRVEQCVKGYLAALDKNAPKPAAQLGDGSGPCYKTIYKGDNNAAFNCQLGYALGYRDRGVGPTQPKNPSPEQQAKHEARTQCIDSVWGGDSVIANAANGGELLDSCIAGYTAAKAGKDADQACSRFAVTINNNANNVYCRKGVEAANAQAQGGDNDGPPSCESTGNFALSWILCTAIEGLASATDGIYSNLIQPLLQTKPINIADPQHDPSHIFAIWSNFRLYGNIFLIIALLVVVFGESISGGLIDAYTAKKILPRLLVAAVLINTSIYIVAVAVDVTNIVGNGIASLIQAPFHQAACAATQTKFGAGENCFALNISGPAADIGGLGLVALVGGGVGAGSIWVAAGSAALLTGIVAPLLEFLLIAVLIPAFLTFIAIMVTVLLRQGLILFLVLISPVAFALYCLPNTEQYFRKWWDLLFKTLLIYPLIAVFFALGNVLSVTISSATSGISDVFADFLAITALFVPLFLIPFSFRIAGSMLGRFHDIATSAKQRTHKGLVGSEQDPESWRNRTRDKLRQGRREAGFDSRIIGDSLKAVPGSKKWRGNWQARRASSRALEGKKFMEHDSVAQANQGNDQYLLAVANPKLAKTMRDKEAAAGNMADVTSWNQAISNANITPGTRAVKMEAAMQHAATGFQYEPGQKGYNQLAETMAGVTGLPTTDLVRDGAGNVTGARGPQAGAFADAMDQGQYRMKQAGRWDMAGINRASGYDPESGLKKASLYEIANGKPESITAMAQDATPHGPVGEDHAIVYKELQAMLPNAKGASRDKIVKEVEGLEARGVQGYINAPTGNVRRGRQTFDPASPNAHTWSPQEQARGWRITDIPETRGDLAEQKARSYERPDPNNLGP